MRMVQQNAGRRKWNLRPANQDVTGKDKEQIHADVAEARPRIDQQIAGSDSGIESQVKDNHECRGEKAQPR